MSRRYWPMLVLPLLPIHLPLCATPGNPAELCPSLSASAAQQRVEFLQAEVRRHNELYYQKLTPELSDQAYDLLVGELTHLERCFPQFSAGSPLATVGDDARPGASKLRHDHPMLSLASSSGPEAVHELLQRCQAAGVEPRFLVQPKVDGLPVELLYLSGRLTSAATRGDGVYGEDVTTRAKGIVGIPPLLAGPAPPRVAVRGEVYADRLLMKDAAKGGTTRYATPRHFAAGVLRSEAPEQPLLAALRFFPFELVGAQDAIGAGSDLAALAQLKAWGFPVRLDLTEHAATLEDISAIFERSRTNRDTFPFAADGIVVKVDDLARRRQLGEGARAPFWAAAWKFPPASASTVVRQIRWQVGRTGRRTPVAEVEPVSLGGITVNHVTLHNAQSLQQIGVAPGDRVVIGLAGDVIPQIQSVIAKGEHPDRSEAASKQEPRRACLSDGPGCREQFLERARYFVSRHGLGIAGLGKGRLRVLVERGLVHDLPSFFRLEPQQMRTAAGFGKATAERIAAAIKMKSHPGSFRLLQALGIPGVGPAAVKRLAARYPSLGALLAGGSGEAVDTTAVRVRAFFATVEGAVLLEDLQRLGVL